MPWYRVTCKDCHKETGYEHQQTFYLFERTVGRLLTKFRYVPGVPHDKLPEIRILNDNESSKLIRLIYSNGMSLKKAKNKAIRYNLND